MWASEASEAQEAWRRARQCVTALARGRRSRSLKRVWIPNPLYGDLSFAKLFRILPDCRLLEDITLSIDMFSEQDLAQVKQLPRLPRPINLQLPERHQFVWSDVELGHLTDLLEYHPEVRVSLMDGFNEDRIGETDERYCTKVEFWHNVNMNSHGRYLLDRPNVPLSIWPLVLEKVNDNDRVQDKASILYGLLQGPAGAQRTSFERRGD